MRKIFSGLLWIIGAMLAMFSRENPLIGFVIVLVIVVACIYKWTGDEKETDNE